MYIDLKLYIEFLVTLSDVFYTYAPYVLFVRAFCMERLSTF